jgi:hypothetical protein
MADADERGLAAINERLSFDTDCIPIEIQSTD